jgi:hypothetical protein
MVAGLVCWLFGTLGAWRLLLAPDDRPEPRDRADGEWEEPYDGDVAWERDQWWHTDTETDYGQGAKA